MESRMESRCIRGVGIRFASGLRPVCLTMDYNMLILGCEFVAFVLFFILFASAANDIAYPFWTQLIYLLVAIREK